MKKILPVNLQEITNHPGTAALFGILDSLQIGKEWVYTNFIMTEAFVLQGERFRQSLDFVMDPAYEFASVCPYILRSEIQGELLRSLVMVNIVEVMKKAIDIENYIYVTVDEDKFLHRGSIFLHELFIYGYDDEVGTFFVGDFTFTGKYSFALVPFKEMEEAYSEAAKDENGGTMVFWKVDNEANYRFDISLVRRCLEEYLAGESYNQRFNKCFFQAPENICGIKTYDFLISYMYKEKDGMTKCLHNLLDHKRLMVKRLKFMEENNYISKVFSEKYEEIRVLAEMACNLSIKNTIVKKTAYLDKIVYYLRQIENMEKEYLGMVIQEISAYA